MREECCVSRASFAVCYKALTSHYNIMNNPRLGILVLAAGEGTRMRSSLPKVLHPICGRPLLGHVLAVADALDAATSAVVLAPDTIGQVRAQLGPRYQYAVQAERLGTGHAVLQARHLLLEASDDVLVLYGDTPLLRAGTARAVVAARRERGALLSLLSFHAHPPTGYGRVVRDTDGEVIELIEERSATPAQRAITEGNSGIMCFDGAWLWEAIGRVQRNPVKGEYYLTDLVAMAVAERGPGAAVAIAADDEREAWGVNDRAQLAEAAMVLRARILGDLMRAGVTVADPAATYVDVGVSVGVDTTLLPGTLLKGATHVGGGCTIGPHTTIADSTIGDRARVRYALVERAAVPDDADIGPFVHLSGETQNVTSDE
jgi:bifunctional UDP-N-acetylglucosamine pyrophosphorylase/glucosamine-1-phosphate N-acetyltransferase